MQFGPSFLLVAAGITAAALPGSTASGAPKTPPTPVRTVPLKNPGFEQGVDARGVPEGWSLYGGVAEKRKIALSSRARTGRRALLIRDDDTSAEVGIVQRVRGVRPGENYEASVWVRGVPGRKRSGTAGAYLQLRFLPSNQIAQTALQSASPDRFTRIAAARAAPPGTTAIQIYLYTHAGPTPAVILDDVALHAGVDLPEPPPPPPPRKAPVYNKLKDLVLRTDLVAERQPRAWIVTPAGGAYAGDAARIQSEIAVRTGVTVPIVTDDAPEAVVPLRNNLIVLGNRSTNRTISALYDRYYCLLDLKYPGKGGYVLRTLHNPFGNRCNVVFVGGSEPAGVRRATDAFVRHLPPATDSKTESLALGWLLDVDLGEGLKPPRTAKNCETWDASVGYGSVGYFGWNSISKYMALYYMTGKPRYAREALRLAFPDAAAKKEIAAVDGERIENKNDPLAGAYHYNQHMMVLFWDLIEESPVFTDGERLKVTNALARQIEHEDYARRGVFNLRAPATAVSSRHGQWAAVSLYCLGRYFARDYPGPVWTHCKKAAEFAFASLHKHAQVAGESDNLFWYSTGIAPLTAYLVLSGDRVPLQNGVYAQLLRGLEILFSGVPGDRRLRYASLGFLNKAAHLTRDGRWVYYRDRVKLDTNIFRVGQSFWPSPELAPAPPLDLCGKWSFQRLPEPLWLSRGSGIPLEQSFFFGSFRTAPDAAGDFILLDGFNGASRNPYHTFDILNLRIGGVTLLDGYHNQVLTKADGMVAPKVAMDAALLWSQKLGSTAAACGEVPRAAFCNWRRTLVQRLGRYALIIDDLEFRRDSDNMTVTTEWQPRSARWFVKQQRAIIRGSGGAPVPPGWLGFRALDAPCRPVPDTPGAMVRLESLGIVLLRAREPGPALEMTFTLDAPCRGEAFLETLRYKDRGFVRILLDGKVLKERVSQYANAAEPDRIPLGRVQLDAGAHRLRLEAVDKDGGSACYAAITALLIKPDTAPSVSDKLEWRLSTSDPVTAGGGAVITTQWADAVKKGEHGVFFHVLAQGRPSDPGPDCLRLADNAAVLRLPEPAIACVGPFSDIQTELAVLARHHLFARGLRRAGPGVPLISADQPLDVDWDFSTGRLAARVRTPTTVELSLRTPQELKLNGKNIEGSRVHLGTGHHELTDAFPANAELARLERKLEAAWTDGRRTRETARADHRRRAALPGDVPRLAVADFAALPGKTTNLILLPDGRGGRLIAAAEGNTVHLFDAQGRELRTLRADAEIRVLRWWPKANALLAGCRDEKVIAFNRDSGVRKWVFVSKMDPAVFRAAKTYWFKSAPGHEGIHGLTTGPFIGGRSQCLVGSACTLEVLDANGKLAKRMPVFWGPGKIMRIVKAGDGSHDALIARWPNGTDSLSIVNSRTLTVRRGFYGVPAGQTMVGGWSAQNRVDLIWRDMDADGVPELVSATNGRWNRVTVFNRNGQPQFNAQFGPGPTTAFRECLRDLECADLDGDGKPEILTATWEGLVVALDGRCRLRWSRRLPSPPRRLHIVERKGQLPTVLCGCDNGSLVLLDAAGGVRATGRTPGRVLAFLDLPDGQVLAATTQARLVRITVP